MSAKVKTCNVASVDPSMLGKGTLTLPGDITVSFLNMVAGNPNAYHYGSNVADIIITHNPRTGGIHGHFMTSTGLSYTLEYCGDAGHVWKEVDVQNLGSNEGIDYIDVPEIAVEPMERVVNPRPVHDELLRQGLADNTTVYTYSVKFYYTPSFAAVTPDIEGFIDQVLAETNQGYANSLVPLRVVKHCLELATIDDVPASSDMLSNFRNMKSSTSELRGSADAAALLINDFSSCGIAYLNVISSGNMVSVTKKSCAVGYYSFGHEVGHNIGLHHDPLVANNTAYPYGHGHLIAQGSANTGYRTILAYSATGHNTRVNYYSNPAVILPTTGTPTGVEGKSDNAALLTLNRISLSTVGDESSACSTAPTAAPTTATSTLTPTTAASTTAPPTKSPTSGICNTVSGAHCIFPFKYNNRIFDTCTTSDGDPKPLCVTALSSSGNMANSTSWGYCSSNCPGGKSSTL